MKVISGKYKGYNLLGHDLIGTRPTMDRVKESVFATIQNDIKESTILDLFAGSGALGIEALSMGAKKSYFVDLNKKAIKVINENLNKLKINEQEKIVINKDYIESLQYFKESNLSFDIIFLDPPYKEDYITKSIKLIEEYNLLKKDGLLVCETDNLEKIKYITFKEVKTKKYGDKFIVILKKL